MTLKESDILLLRAELHALLLSLQVGFAVISGKKSKWNFPLLITA
jgi:hypothetical protein